LIARPALAETSQLTALELIAIRVHDIAIEQDKVNGSDRSLGKTEATAEARVCKTVITLQSPLNSGTEVITPREGTAS
jgi:hypothetical protein